MIDKRNVWIDLLVKIWDGTLGRPVNWLWKIWEKERTYSYKNVWKKLMLVALLAIFVWAYFTFMGLRAEIESLKAKNSNWEKLINEGEVRLSFEETKVLN